jgi:hypothetical protein
MEKNHLLIIILIILLCIVIYQFFYCMENFETNTNTNFNSNSNSDNTSNLYIFITKSCPHCVDYINNTHPKLVSALANTNINLKLIYPDTDPDGLFNKYNVHHVPAFYCVKGNKKMKVDQVDPKSLIHNFKSM